MRILFVADGRSPTTLHWLQYWIAAGHEVHLVSTFRSASPAGLKSFHILPVAFGKLAGGQARQPVASSPKAGLIGRLRGFLRPVRYVLGPLSLPRDRRRYLALVREIQPDFVHALRLPFEGMLAVTTPVEIPLLVSLWGNDLTLHARGSWMMSTLTRRVLGRADGLLADTERDIRLGREWGFDPGKPTLVVPGGGGIQLEERGSVQRSAPFPEELPDGPIVVNPRGQRPGSLRQDIFFQAIPLVLKKIPQAYFVCPPLAGDGEAERWVDRMGIRANTRLWPHLDQSQLWSLFEKSQVFVSPSIHDGTPNSLLEAMACGCFPVVGNIESMREWIRPGVNGLLVDAASPRSLADGIIAALENPSLRESAKNENARVIAERAGYRQCMAKTEAFYRGILKTARALA